MNKNPLGDGTMSFDLKVTILGPYCLLFDEQPDDDRDDPCNDEGYIFDERQRDIRDRYDAERQAEEAALDALPF